MSLRREVSGKLPVVVDLSVEDNRHGLVFVVHRLMASWEVDDAEASHCEANRPVHEITLVVRASMGERIVHPLQERLADPGGAVQMKDAGYAAHRGVDRRFVRKYRSYGLECSFLTAM